MRKLVSILLAVSTIGTAQAEDSKQRHALYSSKTVTATIEDHLEDVKYYEEFTDILCTWENVPVYGSGYTPSGSSVLGGMILGGLLGKALTGDNNLALGGAVVGGVTAGESRGSKIIGSRSERVCRPTTKYVETTRREYSYSLITFEVDGQTIEIEFYK
tara:strand:- start:467 stop:943 length:477 start_codon:yes stop_codon:yes gene_type:complete